MPTPRWVARANKIGLNRVTKLVATWAPGWAIVIHRGRKSGRIFRTPLWAFRRHGGYVIALTYGSSADWVQNVLAAGGCELQTRRRRFQLGNPTLYRDDNATDMPAVIRFMLRRVIKAPDFLRLDVVRDLLPQANVCFHDTRRTGSLETQTRYFWVSLLLTRQ